MEKWLRVKAAKLHAWMTSERGDTNFISILVVLAIVMVVAGTFIGFKDQILGWVQDSMPSFFDKKLEGATGF